MFWLATGSLLAAGAVALQVLGPPAPLVAAIPVALTPVAPTPGASSALPAPAGPAWNGRIAGPDQSLLEASRAFPLALLPRIAADGRLPREAYRRPAPPPDARPRIALVLAGVGLSGAESRAAIEALPGPVTVAVSAYTPSPEALLDAARARGHEILLSLPMEPDGHPLNDAGPRSLLTGAEPAANRTNLEWALGRLQGYVGVTGASDGFRGERFAAQTSSLALVMDEIGRRGLLYLDPRPGAPRPRTAGVVVDLVIDDPSSRAEIEAKLAALERLARERGSAVGLAGSLRPVTVERIAAWAREVEGRGFALVPVSALAQEPAS